MQEGNELVDTHTRRGGRAIVLEDGRLGEGIVLRQGRRSTLIAPTQAVPATFGGRARMNVANAMAAAAAALAAGAHVHDIRAGLRSFTTSYEVAARHFDALIVREDRNLRGRRPGEVAELVATGARASAADGARCRSLEVVLDELEASRLALDRANPGDLVVLCADRVDSIVDELQSRTRPSPPAGGGA
jgi:UDP-N-acetylmuramyl tripeptide synthase